MSTAHSRQRTPDAEPDAAEPTLLHRQRALDDLNRMLLGLPGACFPTLDAARPLVHGAALIGLLMYLYGGLHALLGLPKIEGVSSLVGLILWLPALLWAVGAARAQTRRAIEARSAAAAAPAAPSWPWL